MRWCIAIVAAVVSCGGNPKSAPEETRVAAAAPNSSFAKLADRLYWAHFEFRPHAAIRLGYHQYDGKVPDRSAAAIRAEVARLAKAQRALEGVDASALSRANRLDREVLLAEIRKERFDLQERKRPQREPLWYLLFDFSLEPYVDREYAPLPQRAKGLLAACRAAPKYYQQMRTNLEPDLARPALQIGVMMSKGSATFVDTIVRTHIMKLPRGPLRMKLENCIDALVAELGKLSTDLAARIPKASNDFALGTQTFLRMLAETQGIRVDLPTLERIGSRHRERPGQRPSRRAGEPATQTREHGVALIGRSIREARST